MVLKKLCWASARLFFVFFVTIGFFSGGLLAIPLGPLYSWLLLSDWRAARYRRLVFPAFLTAYHVFRDYIRDPAYRSSFLVSLTAPPRPGPDASRIRLNPSWPVNDGTCNGCVKCCVQRDCPFINPQNNNCLGYGSFFWRYFNCGRYPETLGQLKYYNCEKWEVVA